MKNVIAERIRIYRTARGFSQENIANELNISPGAYSNIERGVTDITVTRLLEIAAILDVDIYDLMSPDAKFIADRSSAADYVKEARFEIRILFEQLNKCINEIEELKTEVRLLKTKTNKK